MMNTEPLKHEEDIKEETRPSNPISETQVEDKFHTQLFDYFNIDGSTKSDPKVNDQIKLIYDYFKDESKDLPEMLWKIQSMESRMKAPNFGEKRFQNLFNYIVLLGDRKTLEKRISGYERI